VNITSLRHRFARHIEPLATLFVKAGLSPNQITLLSLLCGMLSALLFFRQAYAGGSVALLASALLDLLDGAVARRTGTQTRFGAVIDWIVDKYVDALVLLGAGLSGTPILTRFFALDPRIDVAIAVAAVVGSFMNTFIKPVTYAEIGFRQRESGKIDDPLEGVGFFGRPETLIVLVAGGLTGLVWLSLLVTAVGTHASALQRIRYLYRHYA
jgi:archaetidylinositol phosphate synthase